MSQIRELYRQLGNLSVDINRFVRESNYENRSHDLFTLQILDSRFRVIEFDKYHSETEFVNRFNKDEKYTFYLKEKYSKIYIGVLVAVVQSHLLIFFKKHHNTSKLKNQDIIYHYIFNLIEDNEQGKASIFLLAECESGLKFDNPKNFRIREIVTRTSINSWRILKAGTYNLGYYTRDYKSGEALATCFIFNFFGSIPLFPAIVSIVGPNLGTALFLNFTPTLTFYLVNVISKTYKDLVN